MLSYYRTARKYGADFQVLIADLYGFDFTQPEGSAVPGDNGDWSSLDQFIEILTRQMLADGMIDGVSFDMWNECDNSEFMGTGLQRWLDYWGRAYHKIKASIPNAHITGPSYGHLPEFAGDKLAWFADWAHFIAKNNSVPDAVSMHFLYEEGDLATSIATMQSFLQDAGINYTKPFMINEYGNIDQEVPSGIAWQIAQHERNNAWGLKSNWRAEYELHDYLGNILGKPHTYPNHIPTEAVYWPTTLYQVYKYYGSQMKGYRVRTVQTEDTRGDAFVTVDPDERKVRILVGTRKAAGPWSILIWGLDDLGLGLAGQLPVHTLYFRPGGLYEEVDAPVDHGVYTHE